MAEAAARTTYEVDAARVDSGRSSWNDRLMRCRLGLILTLATTGCVVNVGFDPFGTAQTASGSWTIAGAAPSAASCEAAGVDYVRVRLYDGDGYRDGGELVFGCADGAFDTRPEGVLAGGTWTLGMVAIDADGQPIAMQAALGSDAITADGHITLPNFDVAAAGP